MSRSTSHPGRKRGLFITFEGIDGSGKSTQLALAERYLKQLRYSVVSFREPGSTKTAEQIRSILLHKNSQIPPIAELLLYEAARADFVSTTLQPALLKHQVVLCDRFYDSTTAYQGYGRKLDLKLIRELNKQAAQGTTPDLTLVFDLSYSVSCTRRGKNPDRLERESKQFFERVRKGFRSLAKSEPQRVKIVDAGRSIEEAQEEVRRHLDRLLYKKR